MLDELKFVQGAVAKKDLLPALTHFKIENGTIRSFNGTLALCTPIDLDINCTPKAIPFVKAIGGCKETVTLTLTPKGKLSVKSGVFRAYIECVEEETPHVLPEGEEIEINGEELLKAFKNVSPFIGIDASRPWSNGVLLKGASAYATNNVSLIEYWIGTEFPSVCNVPFSAVKEILRIGLPPTHVKISENNMTFIYGEGKWLRTSLLSTKWPDLEPLLNCESNQEPIPDELYKALEIIKPFVDKLERVYIARGNVSTTILDGDGASYALEDFKHEGVYQIKILMALKGIATTIDFSTYPKPCLFMGDKLRGALIGMRSS